MAVGWVVAIAVVALMVGASVGTLLTAVVIAAGRAQREGADAACPTCSSPFARADGAPSRPAAPGLDADAPADA